ncbi:hypothetical protein A3C37_03625 [Candidatus Peribacteria bacterium RIFCSPHIGHO2_02_FULL_53_20]|nr:MAG: hypothetical protein A3C37_03625 [Candidatus Peribacteria bacterium RIFCSPHIGHO2_02_FULL_53_20]OGJ67210.1 MAG: hypothetical protein A3B61_01915 [Candidatus Peribacteria bacterium RIFCSPLOWO2_01_FULL_53_10]OGJ69360.1 MAG: hypothetical protein A3G69_00835 [Candidatus Peribacteria bacterium RIFCSPLOWO2_12_FULL_53_10]
MAKKKLIRGNLNAPATKQDIALIMDSIGKHYDATERWKDEILDATERWKEEMKDHMSQWKNETMRHFDVVAEQLTHDFQGALSDKISVHDDHLKRHDKEIHAIHMHVGMRI